MELKNVMESALRSKDPTNSLGKEADIMNVFDLRRRGPLHWFGHAGERYDHIRGVH